MKAIIIAGPGEARIIETAKPAGVGPKDILIRVAYTGICGTDLAILSGNMSLIRDGLIKYPVRIGHEWSGIVEEVGDETEAIRPGDRVVSDSAVACGQCGHCLEGHYELCGSCKSVGTVSCWDGAFAEYMLMPERHLYKLPDDISLEEAALIEPAAIALAGLKHGCVKAGSTVLIIGTGPIGLAAVPLAKTMGAAKVMISGRKPHKLGVAKMMGADTIIDAAKENLADIVGKETGGKGADVIIETSGNITVINQCVDVVRFGGIIALIGFYEVNLNEFCIDKFVMKCAQMKGILGEFGLPQEVINMRRKGKFSFEPLITHKFRFNEAIEVMKTANEKNETRIKMLIDMTQI